MDRSQNIVTMFSPFENLIPWLIVGLVFSFCMAFLAIPQIRQLRAHQNLLKSLKVGDVVVTSGGLIGELTAMDGDIVHISFAGMSSIPVLRSAIERPSTKPN